MSFRVVHYLQFRGIMSRGEVLSRAQAFRFSGRRGTSHMALQFDDKSVSETVISNVAGRFRLVTLVLLSSACLPGLLAQNDNLCTNGSSACQYCNAVAAAGEEGCFLSGRQDCASVWDSWYQHCSEKAMGLPDPAPPPPSPPTPCSGGPVGVARPAEHHDTSALAPRSLLKKRATVPSGTLERV
jgi:hypothetical protein